MSIYIIFFLILAALPLRAAVRCRTGIYSGCEEDGVLCFRGIPYAQSPVGSLRFRPAEPLAPGNRSYDAVRCGDASLQPAPTPNRQSEDCLWLNLWTSKNAHHSPKPVMVFVHGGAFVTDSAAMDIYSCAGLAKSFPDMVFVSVEYRLGLLGFGDFRSLEGLAGEACPVPGISDVICALTWIRDNAEAFGGDPDRVTLFGQSAGAVIISLLPLFSEARPLFRRMILQSGSPSLVMTPEKAAAALSSFMRQTGCGSREDLERLPDEAFRTFAECAPVLGCGALPDTIGEIYARAAEPACTDKDLMTGTNTDEMDYFVMLMGRDRGRRLQEKAHARRLALLPPELRRRAEAVYSPERFPDPAEAACRFAGDALFHIPARTLLQARPGGRSYLYSFRIPSGKPGVRACHAVELSYVFGTSRYGYGGRDMDMGISRRMQELWTSFARCGRPVSQSLEAPEYASGRLLAIDPEGLRTEKAAPVPEGPEALAFVPILDAGLM
ncbi:MAG: carboxylesterase/lipase family protein [Abditibacteriota bacterium]|nr:carboxylesterase/lipase family protein [Abditibacteriota bacterium]